MNAWLLLPSVVLLAACSSATNEGTLHPDGGEAGTEKPVPTGACDAQHCNVPDVFTCWQWSTHDSTGAANQQQLCTEVGGTLGSGPCPKDKQVGGCQTALAGATDGCSITWGYPPITADDVKADCADQSGVLVTP